MAFCVDGLDRTSWSQDYGCIDGSLDTSQSCPWREGRHLNTFDATDIRIRLNLSLGDPDLRPGEQNHGENPTVHFAPPTVLRSLPLHTVPVSHVPTTNRFRWHTDQGITRLPTSSMIQNL